MSARVRLAKVMKQMNKKAPPKVSELLERKWDILRGDKVEVIASDHSEKGKQGIVLKVLRAQDRLLIEGVNIGKKNIKGDTQRGIQSRTYEIERSVPYSSVNLVDPITNRPTRIIRKIMPDGSKVRVSKKSGAIIPRPDILTMRKRPVNSIITESCTLEDDVWEVTYVLKDKLNLK